MRPLLLRATAATAIVATSIFSVAACGSRSGLPIPEPSACVSLEATAKVADLDVFLLVDSSSSMERLTAQGVSKWQAVRTAIASFLKAPASEGIGATMGFFPLTDESIPELCSSDATCGAPGSCQPIKVCIPDGVMQCSTDQDCADEGFPGDSCQPLGFCEQDPESTCLPALGFDCSAEIGPCVDAGFCENRYLCDPAKYAAQMADVTPLPGAAFELLNAIDATTPAGGTTTLPALEGTLDRAITWTQENPGHKAIVVLATDGLPTLCDPALKGEAPEIAVANVAKEAAAGVASGVQTFVIGVFEPDEAEIAAANLNAIAGGGGTESAYLVSTADDVTELFLATLEQVRQAAKSCEFAIPRVNGALPDLTQLVVFVTPDSGTPVSVTRRPSAADCDPKSGGFYYDTALGGPVPPGRVILCPASCGLFGTSTDRTVKLEVSCDE